MVSEAAEPYSEPHLQPGPVVAALRSVQRVPHVPSRRADGTHAGGAGLRHVGGDPDPGACGRLAHPRDSVPLYVPGLRPLPRAALQVRMGLRENPGADVETAQLCRFGRLRSPGLRQPDLAAAVLAANATSDRPRLS